MHRSFLLRLWLLSLTLGFGIGPAGGQDQGSRVTPAPIGSEAEISRTMSLEPQSNDVVLSPANRSFRNGLDASPATSRHALLIGNSAYQSSALRNPINDVRALDQALAAIGFQVTRIEDADLEQMDEAVTRFAVELPEDSLAMLFYAGHGVQVDMQNYLIPIGARITEAAKVPHRTLSLNMVLDLLGDSRSKTKCVILDCCRDNPFTRSWSLNRGEIRRGLAGLSGSRKNMVIAYSTAEGETASDGAGQNSPYVEKFLEVIAEPNTDGLYLRHLITRTAQKLRRSIEQSPWSALDDSMDDVCLIPPANANESEQTVSLPKQPATSPLLSTVASSTTTSPTPAMMPEPKDSFCLLLLQQARLYEDNHEFQNAIGTYTTVLNHSRATPSDKDAARRGRAIACMARCRVEDIKMALEDTLAVGQASMFLPIRINQTELMDGSQSVGTLRQGQVVEVREINGPWISVYSVGNDASRRGHVKLTSLAEPEKVASSEPQIVKSEVSQPSQSWNSSAIQSVPQASPSRITVGSPTTYVPAQSNLAASSGGVIPNYQGYGPAAASNQPTNVPQQRSSYVPQGTNSYVPPKQSTSTPNRGSSASGSSNVYNMTLAESQKLIDANERAKWRPGADHAALNRANEQIRQQRRQRLHDYNHGGIRSSR
ncbi:caspase family protein [Neorhodopirellula pilleata]|uniref:Caspase domain protein n=1 Tax=Neorhodopirellula pilleata TaxID=2714738 RepID=A0A5C5ZX28_9BACT|nr:caspase family protein [Neorhodopirellula pilleata]TWT92164.1 Caspase domain protein [Neorhodopirellula pilleata]